MNKINEIINEISFLIEKELDNLSDSDRIKASEFIILLDRELTARDVARNNAMNDEYDEFLESAQDFAQRYKLMTGYYLNVHSFNMDIIKAIGYRHKKMEEEKIKMTKKVLK